MFTSIEEQMNFAQEVEKSVDHSEKTWRELLGATGFEIKNMWQMVNPYWPRSYPDMILKNPWWVIETQYGIIKVGPRKRVYVIDWSHTGVEIDNFLTGDEEWITHGKTFTHAYERDNILMYLLKLKKELDKNLDFNLSRIQPRN